MEGDGDGAEKAASFATDEQFTAFFNEDLADLQGDVCVVENESGAGFNGDSVQHNGW